MGSQHSSQQMHLKQNPQPSASPAYVLLDETGHEVYPNSNKTRACVIDTTSGLIWEMKTSSDGYRHDSHTYSWLNLNNDNNGGFAGHHNGGDCPLKQCNTQAYIATVNHQALCGKTQWRLPTRAELKTLVDYQQPKPAVSIHPTIFPNTTAQFFWSSTADANDKDSAWGIGFAFGYDYAYFKNDKGHVRLVHGESKPGYYESTASNINSKGQHCLSNIPATAFTSNFIQHDNGTVIDRRNQLMWMSCSIGQSMQSSACAGTPVKLDFAMASDTARRSEYANYSDWRIPNIKELDTITELACEKPAINLAVFPNTAAENYWSNTLFINDPSHQWLVHFKFGENHIDRNSTKAFLRLVRDVR